MSSKRERGASATVDKPQNKGGEASKKEKTANGEDESASVANIEAFCLQLASCGVPELLVLIRKVGRAQRA